MELLQLHTYGSLVVDRLPEEFLSFAYFCLGRRSGVLGASICVFRLFQGHIQIIAQCVGSGSRFASFLFGASYLTGSCLYLSTQLHKLGKFLFELRRWQALGVICECLVGGILRSGARLLGRSRFRTTTQFFKLGLESLGFLGNLHRLRPPLPSFLGSFTPSFFGGIQRIRIA